MANKTSKKTDSTIAVAADAVTVIADSNLSPEQDALLASSLGAETAADAAIPENKPASVFAEIENAYADDVIDDPQLIEHVNNGDITAAEFMEIRGITFEECVAQQPSSQPPASVDPLYDFESAKAHFEKRMTDSDGKLNIGGCTPLVGAMADRHEISKKTYQQLLGWIVSLQPASNNPPDNGEIIRESILDGDYKPSQTWEEAAANAAAIIGDKVKAEIKFEGTKAARLVVDFADIAVALLNEKEAPEGFTLFRIKYADRTIAVDGANKTERRCVAHKELWRCMKERNMLGKVQTEHTTIGKMELNQGTTFDPYSDKSILPYVDKLTMKALLYALGKQGITWGFLPISRTRPSRKDTFEAAVADETKYQKHLCLPGNVLKPNNYRVYMQPEEYETTRNGKPAKATRYVNKTEVIPGGNPDTSLRWLPDECVEPLFQAQLADWELVYEDHARGDKEGGGIHPSGYILRAYDPKVGDLAGRQREGKKPNADEVQTLKNTINKLTGERDAAQAGLDMTNKVQAAQAFQGLMANERLPVTVAELCNAVLIVENLLDHRLKDKPSADLLKRLISLQEKLSLLLTLDSANARYEVHLGDLRTYVPFSKAA